MNVRKFTGVVLAVALIALTVDIATAGQLGQARDRLAGRQSERPGGDSAQPEERQDSDDDDDCADEPDNVVHDVPFLGVRGSNRVTEAIHYTRVWIVGVPGCARGTVAHIWIDSFMPRRRLELPCLNQTPMRAKAVFKVLLPISV